MIICDIMNKSMKIMGKLSKKNIWTDLSSASPENDCIIDLSENGNRWEGSCIDGVPFGYGVLYDEDNNKIYEGFVYQGKRVCFGRYFYPGTNHIEYEGTLYSNRKHGYGIQFDTQENVIYCGYWNNGFPYTKTLSIPRNSSDGKLLSFNVEYVTIGEKCYCSSVYSICIDDNPIIKSLVVGDSCFHNVTSLLLRDCCHLQTVEIGRKAFDE